MRILILGDIVGRSGRDIVLRELSNIRAAKKIDFTIVNVDNAAHGFGVTPDIAKQLFDAGADCLTMGNHGFDQREILPFMDAEPRMLRTNNYPQGTPGRGANSYTLKDGRKVAVIHTMGRLYMDPLDDPFAATEADLKKYILGSSANAIIVDVHAEATSEKMALAHFCDGRVSAVVGTHTHMPTADAQILDKGTAYQTDLGMCGDYNSVIGFDKAVPVERFTRKMPTERLEPAKGPGTVCGLIVETDDKTGLAAKVEPLRLGARLLPTA